jgi:hypothetical protein
MIKKLPSNLGEYLYSPLSLGYFVTVMLGTAYLRYKGTFRFIQPKEESPFRRWCLTLSWLSLSTSLKGTEG